MKKLTEQHKENISKGVKKAISEGRFNPSSRIKELRHIGLAAYLGNPDAIERRAKNAANKMRGRPQRLDSVTGAHRNNKSAKCWIFITPDKALFIGKNLADMVRNNHHLFDDIDLNWNQGSYKGTCRAVTSLRNLATKKPKSETWKGWKWLDKMPEDE